ncbi:MAG: DUF4388 domain-containing protein [Thermoanaerobaculia bacterium]
MSDELTIQGTLSETTVPDLMRSLIRSSESAIVSLEAEGRHDNIYIYEGKIVFATSSDPDLGLAEVLFREGELNLQQYRTISEKIVPVQEIGSALCELGYLRPEELMTVVEKQVVTIVLRALAFRAGNYTLELREELPDEIPRLSIQSERLVLDGVGRIDHWSLVSRGIGRMERSLQHSRQADQRVFHLDMTEEETYIYSQLAEPQTFQELCDRSYLSDFVTCRTAWALLTANLLEDATEETVDEHRAAAEAEMVLESEVERYNGAFQSIFGLVFQKIGDHVYDFIDRVVRHLSPETMPYLSGVNLMNEARVDFDQLLNNLIASGSSDRRAIVESVLNELLTGWIYETRAEFGTVLEAEMNEIIEPLRRI